jgi:polyferredoxin
LGGIVFEEGEVLEVVKAMDGDKALSLDSFSMPFFQAYWDVLKEDIMKVFMTSMLEASLKRASMLLSSLLFRRFQGLLCLRIFAQLV